jgi:hypothetical protein
MPKVLKNKLLLSGFLLVDLAVGSNAPLLEKINDWAFYPNNPAS